MTIALDTPEQINMWVLLSRRARLKLQMKGLKTPGLLKWCKANIGPECTTAAKALTAVNELIAENGGPNDPDQNYIVAVDQYNSGIFADGGIMTEAEVMDNPDYVDAYTYGRLHIVPTHEAKRSPLPKKAYRFQ